MSFPFRYIAVCFPLLHRNLAITYSVVQKVTAYTIPVLIMACLINIPKFLETKMVRETQLVQDDNTSLPYNITTYTIDVTDLRYILFSRVSKRPLKMLITSF